MVYLLHSNQGVTKKGIFIKELNEIEVTALSGGAWTAEHGISGGLTGGITGAGVAGMYLAMATNPVGWVALGCIGAGIASGVLYKMAF